MTTPKNKQKKGFNTKAATKPNNDNQHTEPGVAKNKKGLIYSAYYRDYVPGLYAQGR